MPYPKGKYKNYWESDSNPGKHRKHTPIVSEAQRGAMGAAYAAKTGEIPVSELFGPAKKMFKGMSKAELRRHLKESRGKRLAAKKKRKTTA